MINQTDEEKNHSLNLKKFFINLINNNEFNEEYFSITNKVLSTKLNRETLIHINKSLGHNSEIEINPLIFNLIDFTKVYNIYNFMHNSLLLSSKKDDYMKNLTNLSTNKNFLNSIKNSNVLDDLINNFTDDLFTNQEYLKSSDFEFFTFLYSKNLLNNHNYFQFGKIIIKKDLKTFSSSALIERIKNNCETRDGYDAVKFITFFIESCFSQNINISNSRDYSVNSLVFKQFIQILESEKFFIKLPEKYSSLHELIIDKLSQQSISPDIIKHNTSALHKLLITVNKRTQNKYFKTSFKKTYSFKNKTIHKLSDLFSSIDKLLIPLIFKSNEPFIEIKNNEINNLNVVNSFKLEPEIQEKIDTLSNEFNQINNFINDINNQIKEDKKNQFTYLNESFQEVYNSYLKAVQQHSKFKNIESEILQNFSLNEIELKTLNNNFFQSCNLLEKELISFVENLNINFSKDLKIKTKELTLSR